MRAAFVGLLVAVAVMVPSGATWLTGSARRRLRREVARVAEGTSLRSGTTGGGLRAAAVVVVCRVGSVVRGAARRPEDPSADLRVGAAVLLGMASAALVGPVAGLVAIGATSGLPIWHRRRVRRVHQESVRSVLPDVVDLFRLAVGAGLSVHQAVDVVAPRAAPPIGPALDEVRRRVGLGIRLGEALDALDPLGDPARPLVAALAGAARYGSPIGAALDRVAVDARLLRRRRAEERARKLPIQLLFPLVLCVLPAFGLLAVVPLLAGSLPSLGSS